MSENKMTPEFEFCVPTKRIKVPDDMVLWENSMGYQEYMGFILAINEAVKGKSLKYEIDEPSDVINKLVAVLDKLIEIIVETPAINQPQRFGNQAFRIWLEKVKQQSFNLIKSVLPEHLHRSLAEILAYFMESFGNSVRIDYGTGHEISFIMFLCCLFKMGALNDDDKIYVANKVFHKYLDLVRNLQQTYRMEPAGSHGVWSLDDYQFVPFIWGSSQLIGHPVFEPCSFLEPLVVESFSDEYMFLGCMKYINAVKTGPFAEHSNQLWSISGVASWAKINSGLVKMYKAEVLGKFPVVQHILFGSMLPLTPFVKEPSNRIGAGFMGMTKPPEQSDVHISKMN
ncbi:PREDICTED: serine/threonine-protein phosphatase 2A activator [Nicrophorus vespilloides]|uniref:Serine/threonine-protein phosphatase 2A activator n=1 Tax=Nicrophorus vespilloides TaxID=110193 RepID=A0ABM1NJP3_NICVS|nr:PREDICTED: serine/threonine-protein phosphatase 2A activator [Nicrophorus vespilloides]